MKPNKKALSRIPPRPLGFGKVLPKTPANSEEADDSEKDGAVKRPPIFTDCHGALYHPGMIGWVRGSAPMGSTKL